MPRQPVQSVENSFVKGLVTEATGLTFPENACTETYNCRFLKTGEVTRRLGVDYETVFYDPVSPSKGYTLTGDAVRSVSAVTEYLWLGAAGDGNNNFTVVQVGQYIYFYSVGDSLTDRKNSDSVDLSNHVVSGVSSPYEHPCSFASGDGKLFVVGKHIEPFYVTYDPVADTFSETSITVQIRDIEGDTDDPYAANERPTATTSTVDIHHLYNLWNQGWAEDVRNHSDNQVNPVSYWDSQLTTIPSNHDRWWFFKDTNEEYYPSNQIGIVPSSTGIAPKGHFIFNAFNMARTTVARSDGATIDSKYSRTDQNTLNDTTSGNVRPSAVAFFANRVWYAGVDADGFNNILYYSQIVDDISKVGRCYQQNDPTDEQFYDLLPNDGGTLSVPAISNVVKLMVVENALFVFATNGIWSVTGSEGIGFTATDFSVSQVSSLQNRGRLSFVDVNGVPVWVNSQGIYTLKQDPISGGSVSSLTTQTIQTFFDTIPNTSIPYIKGVFNQNDKCVYWLYKSTSVNPVDRNYEYDRVLVLNTETGTFYPWTLTSTSARSVIGLCVVTGSSIETSLDNVIIPDRPADPDTDPENVVDNLVDLNQVVTSTTAVVAVTPTLKFLVEYQDSSVSPPVQKIVWAEEYNTSYLDFNTLDYDSYFISGYKIRGESNKEQRTSYITVHSRQETNSSVYLQGVWDYKTSSATKRWSNPQQAYLDKINSSYVSRKLKLRGSGLALQIKCYSETGKPFNVIGWSILDTVGTVP